MFDVRSQIATQLFISKWSSQYIIRQTKSHLIETDFFLSCRIWDKLLQKLLLEELQAHITGSETRYYLIEISETGYQQLRSEPSSKYKQWSATHLNINIKWP